MIGKIEKIVYINGYWLDSKEKFKGYKCYIGATYEEGADDDEDEDIFFWFETQEDFNNYLQRPLNINEPGNEFVITSFTEEIPNA